MNTPLMCAVRELTVGRTTYTFCDRVDLDRHISSGDLKAEVSGFVQQSGQIIPLSRRAYQALIVQRPAGTVGKGFTIPELVERGVLTDEEAEALEGKKSDQKAPTGAVGELEPHGDYFLRSKKVGNFTNYDVVNAKGELLRERAFRARDKACAFLDALAASPQP